MVPFPSKEDLKKMEERVSCPYCHSPVQLALADVSFLAIIIAIIIVIILCENPT